MTSCPTCCMSSREPPLPDCPVCKGDPRPVPDKELALAGIRLLKADAALDAARACNCGSRFDERAEHDAKQEVIRARWAVEAITGPKEWSYEINPWS